MERFFFLYQSLVTNSGIEISISSGCFGLFFFSLYSVVHLPTNLLKLLLHLTNSGNCQEHKLALNNALQHFRQRKLMTSLGSYRNSRFYFFLSCYFIYNYVYNLLLYF